MMQEISKAYMVIDKSSYEEIKGATAVDFDANQVRVTEATYSGERQATRDFPAGIQLVRRR